MPFAEPIYENSIVDLAGDALIGDQTASQTLRNHGLAVEEIVNNWRLAHAYPLTIFYNTLRNRSADMDALVAQRSKRLSSIKDKLERIQELKLSQMQDIAGCRAIVRSAQDVYELVGRYKRKYSHHVLDDEDDYIDHPKSDGYRSYHLIYRYYSETHLALEGLKVEMQFRSALQHCWATAVEVADIFYREGLKAHRGSPDWRRFFALMSAAIALEEGTHHIPRTPRNWGELILELRDLSARLEVPTRLNAFGQTLNVIGEAAAKRRGIKYILLLLKPGVGNEQLRLFGFRASSIEEATKQYESQERLKGEGEDAVLVSVSEGANLRRAYPNYFLDTSMFLATLKRIIA